MDKYRRLWGRSLVLAMILSVGVGVMSCSDDDNGVIICPVEHPNALVTVKPVAGCDSFYMQLDDSTRLVAKNMPKKPYGDKEVRAFVFFRYFGQPTRKDCYDVTVDWMDSILTKPMSEYLGDQTVEKYRQDPVELLRDWTVSEDGYLTVRFRTMWRGQKSHAVRLVATSKENPYEVTFFHDAAGELDGTWGNATVAFRLDQLPDTDGKTVDLTLKWKSFSGDKSVTFKYCTRKAVSEGQLSATDVHSDRQSTGCLVK